MVAVIGLTAYAGLSSLGGSAGGEDIDTATEALGEEPVLVDESAPDTATAANGAGGSSGALGSAAVGVSNTGLEGGFTSNPEIGGYWNTHRTGQIVGGEWEVVSGSIDAHHEQVWDRTGIDVDVEGQFMDINGTGPGHIKRTVDVIPNAQYNLSIDVAENSWGGPAVKTMEIIWNGEVISTLQVDLPKAELKTFTVKIPKSDVSQGVLEFKSKNSSAHGVMFDNPTLTFVPD